MPTLSEAELRQIRWSLKRKGIRINVRSYSVFPRRPRLATNVVIRVR